MGRGAAEGRGARGAAEGRGARGEGVGSVAQVLLAVGAPVARVRFLH